MLLPDLTREPVPESTLENFGSWEHLNASEPPFPRVMLPGTQPLVPPLPSCSVPVLIVVPPVCVLLPVSVSVPAPTTPTEPPPLITPAKVEALLREKTSTPLFTTLPASA